MDIFASGQWLPLVFAFLLGVVMLVYVTLDGYDLGVGILSRFASNDEKDVMISSIGPFWDANETWLVLGVGLLLVAFPLAQGVILTSLYLPVAFMLIGLILRGVSFEFRRKVPSARVGFWNQSFFIGSMIMTLTQGYMLGAYMLGFPSDAMGQAFAVLVSLVFVASYSLVGAAWLLMKTEGDLQLRVARWTRRSLWWTVLGVVVFAVVLPLISERIFAKWTTMPHAVWLAILPLLLGVLVLMMDRYLRRFSRSQRQRCWTPFAGTVGIFVLYFTGVAYSIYPYIVPEQILITEAASAPESLMIILVGTLVVLPILMGYTFLAYKIFHGKTKELHYD